MKKLNQLIECNYETPITGISVNTKDLKQGNLFICIKGDTIDRHDYIDEAIKKGAAALITNKDVSTSIPYVKVDNPNKEVIPISQKFYDHPENKVTLYGITGTDGKTSTATIISTLLDNSTCGYIGTNGRSCKAFDKSTDNTTPSPDKLYAYFDEFIKAGCTSIAMEASSEAVLQNRLDNLYYDVIGITNITSEHLNHHKTLENYVNCKKYIMTLTKPNGYCVLNKDDKYYNEVRKICKGKVLTYGTSKDNDLIIDNFTLSTNHTNIKFIYKNKTYNVTSPLLGDFNVYNLACSLLMCLSQGNAMEDLLKNVPNINIKGRLDMINLGQDFHVMVDYAHTPNGITKLLSFVKLLDKNRTITVIGQAGERDAYKRKEVGKIVADHSDLAIFTYEDPRSEDPLDIINDMTENIRDYDNYEIVVDRSEAIKYAINIAKPNDMVLILGKGNETYEKLKDKTIYFNDIEEAEKYIKLRLEEKPVK